MLVGFVSANVYAFSFGDGRFALWSLTSIIGGAALLGVGQTLTGAQPDAYKPQGQQEVQSTTSATAGAIIGEVTAAMRTVAAFNSEPRFLERFSPDDFMD